MELNLFEILKSEKKGKEIVANYISRNEDFITHEERIEVVNIICSHMIAVNPLKHFPSTTLKHLYADAIVQSFPCLGTRVKDIDGTLRLNHDVFFHPVAGGYIENRLKEIRRKLGIRKRKPNGSSNTVITDNVSGEKKKSSQAD